MSQLTVIVVNTLNTDLIPIKLPCRPMQGDVLSVNYSGEKVSYVAFLTEITAANLRINQSDADLIVFTE